jgi:hypothetical protein
MILYIRVAEDVQDLQARSRVRPPRRMRCKPLESANQNCRLMPNREVAQGAICKSRKKQRANIRKANQILEN